MSVHVWTHVSTNIFPGGTSSCGLPFSKVRHFSQCCLSFLASGVEVSAVFDGPGVTFRWVL